MNKILLFVLIPLFNVSLLSAQIQKGVGIRTGFLASKYTLKDGAASTHFGTENHFYVRGVSRVPTGLRSAFQFEAGYSGRGVSSSNSPHSFVGSGTVKFNYLDFGTYYTQQFGNGNVSFFLLGGPTISFALNGNHQFRGQDVELDFEEQGLRQSDFGMELGFGLAAGPRKNVTLEVRYAKGFSNFSLEDADRKMTHSAFHFGFGFFL